MSLTARGARLAEEIDAASRARFARLLSGLPKARRAETLRALQYLVDALDTLDAPEGALSVARASA